VEELNLDINSATLITEGEEFDQKAFEKKILEHGSLQDLVKLVELQKERIQLLDSQMHIMDSGKEGLEILEPFSDIGNMVSNFYIVVCKKCKVRKINCIRSSI
jgi:hypothetical protein